MTAQIDPNIADAAVGEPYARAQMLQLIEDAMRHEPYCDCGSAMTVEADGDTLLLECPTFTQPSTGRLAWLRKPASNGHAWAWPAVRPSDAMRRRSP